MADGGITEAALLAAAAEGTAAAGSTAAALAAAEAAAAATAATTAGTTAAAAGTAAATALPELAAAAVPEAIIAAAPEAVTAATVPESLLLASTEAVPEAATGLLGPAAEADIGFGAGNLAPGFAGYGELPAGTSLPATTPIGTAPYAGSTDLLGQIGNWWSTSSTGDKLKAGGELLSGVSTAKAAMPQEQSPNKTKTIAQGKVGQPSGGERALAEIVEAMLKRKDAYNKGRLGGAPVLYQPRGLLG